MRARVVKNVILKTVELNMLNYEMSTYLAHAGLMEIRLYKKN